MANIDTLVPLTHDLVANCELVSITGRGDGWKIYEGVVLCPGGINPYKVTFWATQVTNCTVACSKIRMTEFARDRALQFMKGAGATTVTKPQAQYRKQDDIYMAKAKTLAKIWEEHGHEHIGRYRTKKNTATGELFSINLFCIPLLKIPSFYEQLKEYQMNPDEGIKISDGYYIDELKKTRPATATDIGRLQRKMAGLSEEEQEKIKIPEIGEKVPLPVWVPAAEKEWSDSTRAAIQEGDPELMKTANDWDYIGFILIYAFTKPTSGQNDVEKNDRYLKNITARLNALKASKADRSTNIATFIKFNLHIADLMEHCEHLNYYPKLKGVILNTIFTSGDHTSVNLRGLLRDHQMTIFGAIVAFISTKTLTALHLNPDVVRHYKAFTALWNKLKEIYGQEGWKYIKLLDPTTQVTTCADFEELAIAARAWLCEQPNSASFAQLINKKHVPEKYRESARKTLPVGVLKMSINSVDDLKEALKAINLEIDGEKLTAEVWAGIINQN